MTNRYNGFMMQRIRESLLISLGIVITTITALAFASMVASIFIAETTQGFATAINESGALRMRSYRIASYLSSQFTDDSQHRQETYQLVAEFEAHLQSKNLTQVLPSERTAPIAIAYTKIQQQWLNEIKPLFSLYIEGITEAGSADHTVPDMRISEDAVNNLRNRYLHVVSDFVNNIDHLVSLFEESAESKIKTLRYFQFIVLLLTTALTAIALVLIYKRIHRPLKQLLSGARRASQRDFNFHIKNTGADELGQLGQAFNTMARDLSEVYNQLEERIQQKTIDLEQSNHSLELLYTTVKRLNETDSPLHTFPAILDDISRITEIGRGAICLNDHDMQQATMLASSLQQTDAASHLCTTVNCQHCLNDGKAHIETITDIQQSNKQVISLPIKDQSKQYGVLIIEPDLDKTIEPWQLQLLETIADHIGIAIRLSQQTAESRRLVLIEERGVIARELHDSLAQSLTFMKIQLSRLQTILKKSPDDDEVKNVIDELRVGLNSAYRELRELLTTFRLKIDDNDFKETLNKTILEFNDRSDTVISCNNQIHYFNLTPNEEIHVLQLIREALSNVVKHSQASEAKIDLLQTDDGNIQVIISDNGSGLHNVNNQMHHYGLNIMKERAKSLAGDFKLKSMPDLGTEITLEFTPVNIHTPLKLNEAN